MSHQVKKKLPEIIVNNFLKNHGDKFKINKLETQKSNNDNDQKSNSQERSELVFSAHLKSNSEIHIPQNTLSPVEIESLLQKSIIETDKSLDKTALKSGTTC